MIKKLFKKLVGIRSDGEEGKMSAIFHAKVNRLHKFLAEKSVFVSQEYEIIKKKFGNLRDTNYHQGLKYLENGDVRDAIFRFRVIKKFWPDFLDAHYQLAYCLLLNKKPYKAKLVLQELLRDHPDFDPKARELLERIENFKSDAS